MRKGFSIIFRSAVAFSLAFLAVCSFAPFRVYAAELEEIEVEVIYDQSGARSVVDMINELRASSEAWIWDSNNVDKVWYGDRGPITFDYDLEQIAMQRAAEAAFFFSHTRPDGSSCVTCMYNGTRYWGENLGNGQETPERIFNAWCETTGKYGEQGHRRLMLSYSYVGISHVVANGIHYWAAAFSSTGSGAPETPAFDGKAVKTVSYDIDFVGKDDRRLVVETSEDEGYNVMVWVSESREVPHTSFYRNDDYWLNEWLGQTYIDKISWPEQNYSVDWQIEDTSIAAIEGNKIVGKKEGRTQLKATMSYLDETYIAYSVITVAERDISKAGLLVEAYLEQLDTGFYEQRYIDNSIQDPYVEVQPFWDFEYTGSPITLGWNVFNSADHLKEGKDFEILYENNVDPGTATVIIKGKGNYCGQREYHFQIIAAEPTATPSPEPTSTSTPTPTSKPTQAPTPAPTETPTPKPTKTPVPTASPMAPSTKTPTPKPEKTATPTSSPTVAVTPTDTPEPTPTEEPIPSETPVPTEELIPSPTETPEPMEEVSPTPEPELSLTETPTPTDEPTPTPDDTQSISPTANPGNDAPEAVSQEDGASDPGMKNKDEVYSVNTTFLIGITVLAVLLITTVVLIIRNRHRE